MDLSKFSDSDLDALSTNDLTKLSDSGLSLLEKLHKEEKEFSDIKPDTGFTGAAKSSYEKMKGEGALVLGKLGLMDTQGAEDYYNKQKGKADRIFKPTEKGWDEAPFEKFRELLGSSAPYMVAPLGAAAAVAAAPEAIAGAGIGMIGAPAIAGFAANVGQFTGTNLGRQVDEGKSLNDANLATAAAAAVPQSILDIASDHMIPGVQNIFGRAGIKLGDKEAAAIAKQQLANSIPKGKIATALEYGSKAAQTAAIEGLNEAGQQVFERMQAGLDLTDTQARQEYFDNLIGGAVLGGAISVPGHYYDKNVEQPRQAKLLEAQRQAEARKKQLEEQQRQQQQLQQTYQNLNVPQATNLLPAPEKAAPVPEKNMAPAIQQDMLQNYNGMFDQQTIDNVFGKGAFDQINEKREMEHGKPRLNQMSIEDLAHAGANPEDLSRLLTVQHDYTNVKEKNFAPAQILKMAEKKGIETGTGGFNSFLMRTTGTDNLQDMTYAQRHAVAKALSAVPTNEGAKTILPEGHTNATPWHPADYDDAVKAVQADLAENKELSQADIMKTIHKATFLGQGAAPRAEDAKMLLDEMVRRGDVSLNIRPDKSSTPDNPKYLQTVIPAHPMANTPAGMDVRREVLGEGRGRREVFSLYENGERMGSFPTKQEAEEHGMSRLHDDILKQTITAAPHQLLPNGEIHPLARRYAEMAKNELNERQGISRDFRGVTTSQGLEGANERLAKLGIFNEKVQELAPEIKKDLEKRLRQYGLANVAVRMMDSIANGAANAAYHAGLIKMAVDAEDPMGELDHESIHALIDLGAFRPDELRVLENKAKSEWLQKYIKDTGKYDLYKKQYESEGRDMKTFEADMLEESVAEAFKHFNKQQPPAGMVGSLFKRISKFFEAVKNAFNGAGFKTADDIFEGITRGKFTPTVEGTTNEKRSLRQYNPDGSPKSEVRPSGRGNEGIAGLGDRGRGQAPRSLAPLEGAPLVQGATGPDPRIVNIAKQYAEANGIPYERQQSYAKVDEERAQRIAQAYENMQHAPNNPKVKAAYKDLIRQTKNQYKALVNAGYKFSFFDSKTDPYDGNPWNAMRDLRNNKHMAVYGSYDGFGTEGITDKASKNNLMLEKTGLRWKDQNGVMHPVTANDLFRAVHDAFGHGLEGAGFRAQGEENAWQAHAKMFTGSALGALTSETRGQNSWLNFGPYAERNRKAKVEDTVFADQKIGLMPDWTWKEGLHNAGISLGKQQKGAATYEAIHYSNEPRKTLNGSAYGKGIRGAEANRLAQSDDPRIQKRAYFYIPNESGRYNFPEAGVGNQAHKQTFKNILPPGTEAQRLNAEANGNPNKFESLVVDAGYDGYAVPNMGMMVILNHDNIPVEPRGTRAQMQDTGEKYSLKAPDTPEFKNWFRDSLVINEDGSPMVVYHGTSAVDKNGKPYDTFKLSKEGALGAGIYLTPEADYANNYAGIPRPEVIDAMERLGHKSITEPLREAQRTGEGIPSGRMIPLFASIENPVIVKYNGQGDPAKLALMAIGVNENQAEKITEKAYEETGGLTKQLMTRARNLGHDGIFFYRDGKLNEVVAFSPSQVKSVFNQRPYRGIEKYSLTNAPPQTLTTLEKQESAGERLNNTIRDVKDAAQNQEFWTGLRNNWVDKGSSLTRTLQNQEVYKDGVLRADLLTRAYAQVINLVKNGLQSGIPIINNDGSIIIKSDAVNNLANSHIIADKLDDNAQVKASGLSGRGFVAEVARAMRGKEILEEDARLGLKRELQVTPAQIAWAEQQIKNVPELNQIFSIWKNVNTALVNLWEAAGLLDKAEADSYRAKKHYVSLAASKADLEEMINNQYTSNAPGLKSTKKIFKLEGSELDRNIWENVDKQYAAMLTAAYQNHIRKTAVDQLRSIGMATTSRINEKGNEVPLYRGDPNINLRYKENGKIVDAIVHNQTDLAAFEAMHYELNPIMKFMAGSTKLLRAGALLNPMFWLRQLIKDPIHANLVANSGIVTPFHSAGEFMRILMKDSEEAKLLAQRGVIGQYDSTIDIYDYLNQVGKEKSKPSTLDKALHKMMQVHEASDAATRVAIFKKEKANALTRGMTEADATNFAVMKARESINFAVHGNSKTLFYARHMVPFLSASITSLDTVYRAATGYGLPPAEKAAAQKLFKQRAFMLAAMTTAYAMLMQNDDDYKKLPDYVKDNNWLIKNPTGDGFIKVPTPFEVGFLFKTIPEAAVRYMYGTSTGKEVLHSYWEGVTNNLPGGALPIPQLFKPAIETVTNHSFYTGNTIESLGDARLPVEDRGRNASEISKKLSKSGLGTIGLSPAKIDNLIQGYMAELGTFTTGMADKAVYAAEGRTPPATNLAKDPFFKSFLTDPNADKAVSDFYQLEQNANQVAQEFTQLKAQGRAEEIQSFIKDKEKMQQIGAAPALRRIGQSMTAIKKQINFVRENQAMSPEDRRDEINRLTAQYNRVAEQGVKLASSIGLPR